MDSEDSLPPRPVADLGELTRLKAVMRQRLDLDAAEPSPRIGRFTVLDRVGHGGMGVVYAVYDDRLDRRVALKLIPRADSDAQRARVQVEARAMAKLDHPNVVSVFEVGEHDGQLFIVMEFVAGETLQAWQRGGPRTSTEVLDAYLQAARGLAAAHAAGVVHRDFKPENAIVDAHGRVRVVDFGLARAPAAILESTDRDDTSALSESATPTEEGAMIGTPAYMSAEQFAGASVDHRADQFAFCVALWEALAGERPFAGTTRRQLAEAVTAGEIRPASRSGRLPAWIRPVLVRGLDPQREVRWESMDALIVALERGRRPARTGRLGALAALGVGGAIAAAVFIARRGDPCVDAASLVEPAWTSERRSALHDTLAGIDAPFAAAAADKVDATLAAHAEAWVAGWRDACEATRVHSTQTEELFARRVRCLESRRRELDALVDVLETADARILANAPRSAAALSRIESCADSAYVSAEVLPPDDPAVAAEAAAIEDDLARVVALDETGSFAAAKALAQESLARAEQLAYPPVIVLALNRLAIAHMRLAEYDEAMAMARRAFVLADVASGDATVRTQNTLGVLALIDHDLDASLMHHQRAFALHTAMNTAENPDTAGIHNNLGNTYEARGDFVQARAHFEEALAIRLRITGERHPYVALSRSSLGRIAMKEGRTEEALAQQRLALDIDRETLGEQHPTLFGRRINLVAALFRLGRYDEAAAEGRVGLAAAARLPDDNAAYLPALHSGTASALGLQGELDDAREHAETGLALHLRAFGEDHPDVANARSILGNIHYLAGRHELALEELGRCIAILGRSQGKVHEDVLTNQMHVGMVLVAMGRRDEGEAELRRTLVSMSAGEDRGEAHGSLPVLRDRLAELHALDGENVAAIELLRPHKWADGEDDPTYTDVLGLTALTLHRLGLGPAGDDMLERLRVVAARHPGQPRPVAMVEFVDAMITGASVERVVAARTRMAELGMWPFVALADQWIGRRKGTATGR